MPWQYVNALARPIGRLETETGIHKVPFESSPEVPQPCYHVLVQARSQIVDLGYTEVPAELRVEFLLDLSDRYTPEAYNLMHNNCNNFRSERACLRNRRQASVHHIHSDESLLEYAGNNEVLICRL